MNYMQIYASDSLYASGTGLYEGFDGSSAYRGDNQCTMTKIEKGTDAGVLRCVGSLLDGGAMPVVNVKDGDTLDVSAQNLLSNASYQILGDHPSWLDGGRWSGPDGTTLDHAAGTAEAILPP